MPEKRNFWLKLNEHFFDEARIMYLLKQKGGEAATILYLKLLLKTLNTGGMWPENPGKQLDVRFTAAAMGVRPDKLRKCMAMLQQLELVKWHSDGSFYVPGLIQMIGSETPSAARMRRKRAAEASQAETATGESDADKDTDSEKDKNKDGDTDTDLEELFRKCFGNMGSEI